MSRRRPVLNTLRQPGQNGAPRHHSRDADRNLVSDAMRQDTARPESQHWQRLRSDRRTAAMPADNIVYVSIELSVLSWLVAARLPGVEKSRLHRLEGGDATALLKTIADLQLKASAKLG